MPIPDRVRIEQEQEEAARLLAEQAAGETASESESTEPTDATAAAEGTNDALSAPDDGTGTSVQDEQQPEKGDSNAELEQLKRQYAEMVTKLELEEQRNRSLQGMFQSLTKQNEQLQSTLQALQQGLEKAKPPKSPRELLGLSEEDAATLDEEQLKIMARVANQASEAEKRATEVAIQHVTEFEQKREKAFVEELNDAVPDWAELSNSGAFLSSLSNEDFEAINRAVENKLTGPIIRRIQNYKESLAKASAEPAAKATMDIMPKRAAEPMDKAAQPKPMTESEFMAQCDELERKFRIRAITASEYEAAAKALNAKYEANAPKT